MHNNLELPDELLARLRVRPRGTSAKRALVNWSNNKRCLDLLRSSVLYALARDERIPPDKLSAAVYAGGGVPHFAFEEFVKDLLRKTRSQPFLTTGQLREKIQDSYDNEVNDWRRKFDEHQFRKDSPGSSAQLVS